jgi:hypothetical protein
LQGFSGPRPIGKMPQARWRHDQHGAQPVAAAKALEPGVPGR